MAESILDSLFNNPQGLKVDNPTTDGGNLTEFRPKYSKGQNEEYIATIRFIPNPRDFKHSIITKNVAFLKEPNGQGGRYIDDPDTIGEKSPIKEAFFMFYNSTDARIKNFSNAFSRSQQSYALVQVLACPAEPKLVGKILVWKFGQKVKKKIDTEMNTTMPGQSPHHPFDLFMNRLFYVKVTKQSGGQGQKPYNNFDECQFYDTQYPSNCMLMEVGQDAVGNPQYVQVTRENCNTPEQQQAVLKYLEEKCPKLEDYEYKPWDVETTNYVNQKIAEYTALATGQALPGMMGQAQQMAAASAMVGNQGVPMQGTAIPMGSAPIQQPMQPMQQIPTAPQGSLSQTLGGAPAVPGGVPQGVPGGIPAAAPAPQASVAPQTPIPGAVVPGAIPGAGAPQPAPQSNGMFGGAPAGVPGGIPAATPAPQAPVSPQPSPVPQGVPGGVVMGIEGNQIPGGSVSQIPGAPQPQVSFQGIDPAAIGGIMGDSQAPIPTPQAQPGGTAQPSLDDVLNQSIM